MNFTDHELTLISLALRMAGEQFIRDAATMRSQHPKGSAAHESFERLAKQFDKQVVEVEALYMRIER